jgi:hypothetical protein
MTEHQIINRTPNGLVYKCSNCSAIHVEFKNLNLNLTQDQFDEFAEYLLTLDGKEWEEKNADSYFKRKIALPIGHPNFRILLHNSELIEMKRLLNSSLNSQKESATIQIKHLEFTAFLN